MSIRAAGVAFLRQERQRHVEAIAKVDELMAELGISKRGRRMVKAKGSRNGTRPVKIAARRRRTTKKPVARAANLAAAATGN